MKTLNESSYHWQNNEAMNWKAVNQPDYVGPNQAKVVSFMPELLFHPDITEEIKLSFDWYQEQVKGLGYKFVQELDDAFNSIQC